MGKVILNKTVIKVPDFVGNEIAKVRDLAKIMSLNVEIAEYEYHDFTEGKVVSQIPAGGRAIYKNRIIKVNVSKGPKLIFIPNLSGFSYQNIDDAFKIYELKLGMVIQHYSNTVSPGYIIDTVPAFGSSIIAGRPVDVIISIGKDPLSKKEEELIKDYIPEDLFYDDEKFYTDDEIFRY